MPATNSSVIMEPRLAVAFHTSSSTSVSRDAEDPGATSTSTEACTAFDSDDREVTSAENSGGIVTAAA